MGDLASLSQVANALGVDELSESQALKAPGLVSRISFLFAREAHRDWVPGTSTNRLRVLDHTVRLSETPTEVLSVYVDGDEVEGYTVQGNEIRFTDRPTFDFVTVAYTHSAVVPPEVSAAVAGIVARWLRVDNAVNPAVGLSTDLSADGFRQSFAEWTTKNVHLSLEDKAEAREYRYPSPAMVQGT